MVKLKEALEHAIDKCAQGLVREDELKEKVSQLKQKIKNNVTY